ncbi:MAG: hypothetical protein KAK00_00365 [Nanoarchaeota archaeon]|nr:hypothetical protein [Nanoarchaeota archaeon]
MGTNYYTKTDEGEELHIGKSSFGWTFSFHATDEIRSYEHWLKYLKDRKIYDEYGKDISLKDFNKLVEAKKSNKLNHALECMDGSFRDENDNSMTPCDFS